MPLPNIPDFAADLDDFALPLGMLDREARSILAAFAASEMDAPEALARLAPLLASPALAAESRRLVNGAATLERVAATSADNPVTATRHAEIRSWYMAQTVPERAAVLAAAIANDDAELLGALVTAPAAFGLVTAPQRAAMAARFMRRADPKGFGSLVNLHKALAAVAETLNAVGSYIATEGGLPEPPAFQPPTLDTLAA